MVRLGQTLVILLLVLLTSCDQATNRVSTLWTNVPEMAAYVEKFNASQREWQILVEYQENPVPLLLTPGRKADLVVARNLSTAAVRDVMVPLDFLFDGGNLAKAGFYRRILEGGQQGDRLKLLPVSFDLPILVFSQVHQPELPGLTVDLGTLAILSRQFEAAQDTKNRRRMGLSPRWESFGLTMLLLQGAAFQENFQGELSWDSNKLAEGLESIRTWSSLAPETAAEFQFKYLQGDPGPSLVSQRIQFYPSSLAQFLSRPWDERRGLDFRFIDQGNRIAALDNVVWAGIPSSSLTRGASERFLSWFFLVETQNKLIAQGRADDDRTFGLARGLPTLSSVNAALVQTYPEMAGRLPPVDQVLFWNSLPPDWPLLKSRILKPWLDARDATEASLKEALEKFRALATRN